MSELTGSREQRDRLLTEYRLISTNKKIDYWLDVEDSKKKIDNWLNVDWFRRTKRSTVDCRCSRLTDWSIFKTKRSTIDCRFVDLKMLYVNSSFNSRRFVLWFRDFFKEFELNVKWTAFIALKEKIYSLTQIHDHSRWFTMRIVKVKCIHRFQKENFIRWRFSFDLRISTNDSTIFFNYSRISTSIFDDFILFIRVSRRAICFDKAFERMSISLAKLKARNLLCKRQWIIVIAIDRKISCWRWNRHELNCAEDEIVTNWSILFLSTRWSLKLVASVKFTSLVTMKIKYNVKNRVWLEE